MSLGYSVYMCLTPSAYRFPIVSMFSAGGWLFLGDSPPLTIAPMRVFWGEATAEWINLSQTAPPQEFRHRVNGRRGQAVASNALPDVNRLDQIHARPDKRAPFICKLSH